MAMGGIHKHIYTNTPPVSQGKDIYKNPTVSGARAQKYRIVVVRNARNVRYTSTFFGLNGSSLVGRKSIQTL